MTEKQDKGLDLLVDIIMLEAFRIKAINEEGADAETYDDAMLHRRLSETSEYQGIFDGITYKTLVGIVNHALEINKFTFTDKRCYSYLYDVIAEDIKYF